MIDWEHGTFKLLYQDGRTDPVEGLVSGSFGILWAGAPKDRWSPPVEDTSEWSYLVHRQTGQVIALFADEQLAAEAAEIAEQFGDWSNTPPKTLKIFDALGDVGFYQWGNQDDWGMVWFRRRGPFFRKRIAAQNAKARARFRISGREGGWRLLLLDRVAAEFPDRRAAARARQIANELIVRPGLLTDEEVVTAFGILRRSLLRLGFGETDEGTGILTLDTAPSAMAA